MFEALSTLLDVISTVVDIIISPFIYIPRLIQIGGNGLTLINTFVRTIVPDFLATPIKITIAVLPVFFILNIVRRII